MNRTDLTPILADIAATMDRIRELDIEGHARAAALQCLADAARHLAAVKLLHDRLSEGPAALQAAFGSIPPPAAASFSVRTGYDCRPDPAFALPGNWPATDNQRVRNKATEAFRESRRILREVIK